MKNKHYVILSSGAYSDYSPIYFIGERKVTQEELNQKSLDIGDFMWKKFNELPERKGEDYYGRPKMIKYNPEKPDVYIGGSPSDDEFIEKMSTWLICEGFEMIPTTGVPEINIYYDVPKTI